MSDFIERLRNADPYEMPGTTESLCEEAADWMDDFKSALEKIANTPIPGGGLAVDAWMASEARAALNRYADSNTEGRPK